VLTIARPKLRPKFSAMRPIRNEAEVQRFRKSTPASRSWSFCRAFRQPPERFCRQEFIVQNLRQRAERNAFVEQALQFDIAARECVAYDYEIRTGLRFVAAKGCATGMPRDSRNVDIGG